MHDVRVLSSCSLSAGFLADFGVSHACADFLLVARADRYVCVRIHVG